MGKRIYNFNAGPAVLPEEVLNEAKEAILCYKDTGIGILEMSHRSETFTKIVEQAKEDLKQILGIGDEFDVLFLQGGASLQFYMVPLNLAKGKAASYVCSGSWSQKAIKEAKRVCETKVVASSEDKNFSYIPDVTDSMIDKASEYLHFTSNNTIFGTEWRKEPASNGLMLVCDASSDFLSRSIDIRRYGLIYAGAQKNLGPSGVTVVVIRKDLLGRSDANLCPMLSYAVHAKDNSLYNTPCTYGIYIVGLVLQWVKKLGGLSVIQKMNEEKALLLYNFLDNSDFYKPTARKDSRSYMNVTYRLPSEELETKFVKEASKNGFTGLKGHRSVGGIRASIYNAFPKEGINKLIQFMSDFEKKNS